ncbi:MAG TPA: NAD(P)H-dependent oxidoreductase subunit E [Anaerohalosphaeraceae bacterium]|nr:NAD(P)H-dependent oxidoreductase subunit E [Anaerohalosphaeraceae bacterium]HOL88560.1 NAD(P)H-dependent oxidoreductase subunit E [Anaerohalosphaeraceae bacterium]HPP56386.1 NAD(P)H-dependent oxidoreductase subunit E [Anaerohalosphaeraceae bacterium]
MKPLTITICTGTTCYVMGSGYLLSLQEQIESACSRPVEIVGSSCLGLCKDGQYGRAPFVQIGSTVIAEATAEKIIETLKQQTARKPMEQI